jgi:hypothetical protein
MIPQDLLDDEVDNTGETIWRRRSGFLERAGELLAAGDADLPAGLGVVASDTNKADRLHRDASATIHSRSQGRHFTAKDAKSAKEGSLTLCALCVLCG